MVGFIRKLLGGQDSAASSAGGDTGFGESSTGEVARDSTRRDLVHMAIRDTLRRHGIPGAWLDCQILKPESPRPRLHLLLCIRQEQERILAFAPVFQDSLMSELRKFDPRVSDWLDGMSWQLLDRQGAKEAAAAPASAAQPAGAETEAPDEKASALEDLQRLFAIRDDELRRGRNKDGHEDFQATQPAFEPTRPAGR